MNTRADSIRVVHPLFNQAEGGGAIPTSALSLHLDRIDIKTARTLNRAAIWTHPIARNLPQDTWLELRRLAIAPDAPKNTASRLLAVMAKLIRASRPEIDCLVSYQDTEVHTGSIYKAAGWVATATNVDGEWDRPNRQRQAAQSAAPKKRWEKRIR